MAPSLPTDALTPDFYATLVAGVIGALAAILGVLIQRSFERKDKAAEQIRQRREIARALLIEIDGFYRDDLVGACDQLQGNWANDKLRIHLRSVPTAPFPVFRSNAYRLGEFESAEVQSLISFFQSADSFLVMLSDANRAQSQIYVANSQNQADQLAGFHFRQVRDALPELLRLARKAAYLMAARSGVDFDPAVVAIAHEPAE